ncbi:hypothetical protein O0L34_g5969 [Tuta absoluta]|nr:hypothetical protein O0L34_g5969 [Tuta absoluta]
MVSVFLILFLVLLHSVKGFIDLKLDKTWPFHYNLYYDALDPELCDEQLKYISQDARLRMTFLEAGMRIPKGLLQLNNLDLGNYDQCLDIKQDIETSVIEGKFCRVVGPISVMAKVMNWQDLDVKWYSEEVLKRYNENQTKLSGKWKTAIARDGRSRTIPDIPLPPETDLQLSVCVPKTCTTAEGIRGLLFNLEIFGIFFDEYECRIKNDKPWAVVDYVAM